MERSIFVSKSGFSPLLRAVATLLVPIQLLSVLPVPALLALETPDQSKALPVPPPKPLAAPATPAPVKVNRTVPAVAKQAAPLTFSAAPTDAEFLTVRIFAEPLLPMGKEKSIPEENRALADAILAFAANPDPDNTAPLKQFLATHPKSVWRVSLLTNLGLIQRRGAYWSEALVSWQEAWNLGKEEQDVTKRLVVDRALAQLAELTARIGRTKDLEALLAEVEKRDVRGPATEKLAQAKQGLFLMKTEPSKSFRCGPLAMGRIYTSMHPGQVVPVDIHESTCTDRGTSLPQVKQFAKKLGMDYQMAWRNRGAPVIVPSVVNWKVGHYAALTKQVGDRYLIEDTTFTDNFTTSSQALDQEASGYFLVPAGTLPNGWRSVGETEGGKVWGQGAVPPNPDDPPPCIIDYYPCPHCVDPTPDDAEPDDANPPYAGPDVADAQGVSGYAMAVYSVDPSRINLTVSDTPLFYDPPRGPKIRFTASYSARGTAPSSTPNYPNLGSHWNLKWVSFVVDSPSNTATSTYGPGGGTLKYTGYTSTGANTGSFGLQALTHEVLERTSAASYVKHLQSGAKEIYNLSDGGSPARIFLTEFDDPAGNAVHYTYDPLTFRLVSVTDALGQVTTLTYVTDNPAVTDGSFYRVATVTDPFGRTASLTYDGSGRLSTITDMAGIVSQFTYGAGDFITKLTTPYGDTTFTESDIGSDRSLLVTDPEGAQEFYQFKYSMTPPDNGAAVPAATGLLTNTTYQVYRTSYIWDKKAYAEAPGDYSKAHLMHWLHTPDGGAMADVLESEKQPYESRVYYNYYGQTNAYLESANGGNLITKTARVLDDGSTQMVQYDYNAQGKRTKVVTPGNVTTPARTTTYTYGANGLDLIGVYQQNPAGASTDSYSLAADKLGSFTYDAGGKHLCMTATDASGQTTSYTYNSFGQLLTATDPLGHTTTMAYDRDDDTDGVTDGYLLSVTGPVAGATTQMQYDGFGRVWKVTNSDDDTVTLAYDAIGGVATKTLNRVAQTTYPDGTSTQVLFDRLDAQWTQDRLGRWTQLFHDKMRRVAAVLDPLGRLTQYQWCMCGALEAIIDPAGNQTTWIRDEQSRVVNKIYPDNSVTTYAYENNTSRFKSVLDAKGQRTNYQYNIDDSLAQVSYTDAGGAALSPPTPTVTYTYDTAYGRIATMTDGIGSTQYAYNSITAPPVLGAGRLASVDGPWNNDTITYSYDELGRLSGRSIDGVNNTSSFGYDTLGRPHTITNPLGAFTYNYVGVTGRMDNVQYPNGQKTQYSYFGAGGSRRLQEIQNMDASTALISQFDCTYDAVGNIITWTQNNPDLPHPHQYVLGYDGADELKSASLSEAVTNTTLRQLAFRSDVAGNRATVQDGNSIVTETPNSLNQLIQTRGGGLMRFAGVLSKPGVVTVGGNPATMNGDNTQFEGYASVEADATTRVHVVVTDGDGNVTDEHADITPNIVASKAFTYDLNGNTTASGPAGAPTVTYGWDATDRLISVTTGGNVMTYDYDGLGRRVREKSNGAETRHWVWEGLGLCEERDPSNNVVKRFYGQGEQIGGVSYYFTRDHLGSVRELVDSTGAIATGGLHARYDYELYGARIANTVTVNPVESDFGFTGHQEFAFGALELIGAPLRFYQPEFGRWLSRDPIEEEGGLNLYAYVRNAPTNFIDPSGNYDVRWDDPEFRRLNQIPEDEYQRIKNQQQHIEKAAENAKEGYKAIKPYAPPITNPTPEGWGKNLGQTLLKKIFKGVCDKWKDKRDKDKREDYYRRHPEDRPNPNRLDP